MKIIEKIKNKRVKVFLISFVLFLIIFIIFDSALLLLSRMRENAISVFQLSIYKQLKDHIAETGEPVPIALSPIRISEEEYYLKAADTYYYPDAWNKPERILLKHRCGNFYYLLFGNRTMATVTHWFYYGHEPNVKPYLLGPTGASKYMFGNLWFIPLGAIVIAITILLIKKEEK